MKKMFGAILLAVCSSLYSQIQISPQMDKAIKMAIEKSQEVKMKNMDVEKIEIERKSVVQKYIPTLEAEASYLHFNSTTNIDIDPIHLESLRAFQLQMAGPQLQQQAKQAMEKAMAEALPPALSKAQQQAQAYIDANGLNPAQAAVVMEKAKTQAQEKVKLAVEQAVATQMEEKKKQHLSKPFLEGEKESSSTGNIFTAGITAKMVLFSGMQIPYGSKALQEKKIGTQYLVEATKEEIAKEVITSFDQLRVLDVAKKLIEDSQKRLKVESDRLEKSIQEGFAIPMDRDKIKLAQLELQAKQVELEGNENLIYQKIKYLTGLEKQQAIEVTDSLEPFVVEDKKYSVEEKAEVKALNSFVKAQQYALSKEKGTLLPQVALLGGIRYTSLFNSSLEFDNPMPLIPKEIALDHATFSPTFFVGIGAKWQIFSGMARSNKIKIAKMELEQTSSRLDDVKEKFNLLLRKNLETYRVSNEKILLSDQKLKVAQNSLDTALKMYREGLIDISQRLEAENDLYKVSLERAQNISAQRQSAIDVLKTSGLLLNYSVK